MRSVYKKTHGYVFGACFTLTTGRTMLLHGLLIQVLVLEPLESEVLRLRDEVDILRPAEAKLSKVEQNLSR